ncbi:ABC transporter ATP-binding protein [Rossellomorea aquimaris]|uniref:ABC transporter ATP-binding protein n=1 Tax=Rossellomorea aquimaris TaxID=189382 RepID=UPI002E273077
MECRELTKEYGNKKALNNLSFTLGENKITGLIGRNGAGKTTLLKMMAGYTKESSGEINVFSENPFNSLKVSANMVYVDDELSFSPYLTLGELLEMGASFYENWDMDFAQRLFQYFSFDPDQYHANLSKGMGSTFNMIFGLSARCPLTIFDEPTTGMDAAVRKDFYRVLLKDYIAYPRTMILSSHLLNEVEDILEDILLLKDGEKCLHMPIEDLRTYAVGVSGKTEAVNEWIKNKEVIHHRSMEMNRVFAVVKRDGRESDFESNGLEVSSVSAEDVCVYLTSKSKGGIDDVFNRE